MNSYQIVSENYLWLLKIRGTKVVILSNIDRQALIKQAEALLKSKDEKARLKIFNEEGEVIEERTYTGNG